MLNHFLSGATMMAAWAIGLFFLRFWKQTRDRFFALLGIAFWVLAAERFVLVFVPTGEDGRHLVFLVRLLAFVLIIVAILDKNRRGAGPR